MDELKPSEKLVGTVMVQGGFHHYEADRPLVLTANAPSLASAIGFQYRVAKAAKNQGPCYENGCVIFDKQDSLHRPTSLPLEPSRWFSPPLVLAPFLRSFGSGADLL